VLDCFGIAFTTQHELSFLATILFSEEVLHACKDTHILFPGYSLSIMDMWKRHPALFSSRDGRWYYGKSFAKYERVQCRWYLLKKSGTKSDDIPDNEVVPRACEVVFGLILACSREQILFTQNRVACCGDQDRLVYVGTEEWGISIGDVCNALANPQFASMAK
jgi:hypothetical protein